MDLVRDSRTGTLKSLAEAAYLGMYTLPIRRYLSLTSFHPSGVCLLLSVSCSLESILAKGFSGRDYDRPGLSDHIILAIVELQQSRI